MSKTLTVIIPLRATSSRPDVIERLNYQVENSERCNDVDFLVVDDGSAAPFDDQIKETCERNGMRLIRLETSDKLFSFGRCRNVGVSQSTTPFVMFLDVDLVPYDDFYKDLINEIEVRELHNDVSDFIMVGVIYLTKQGTQQYFDTTPKLRKQKFTHALLEDNHAIIEKFSTGTSVTVYSRPWYMAHGGVDESFEGWGYEDLEFNCRMIRLSKKFPLPSEFSKDYRNFKNIVEYKGWKSIYRLFGDLTFYKGIVLFHAWHPVETNGDYMKRKGANEKLFNENLLKFARDNHEPWALPMPEAGSSIFFNKNPFVYNRLTAPYFGRMQLFDPKRETPESIVNLIQHGKADRVVFFNPYADEHIKSIYEAVKAARLPFFVCERGALRDSVFIDPNGFNAESESYHAAYWDKPLSDKKRQKVMDYINEEKTLDASLEKQPERLGELLTRKQLGLEGKKILFVPFQRPSDTVIQYFCGEIETFDNFVNLVRTLADALPSNWSIVGKRHPLEDDLPDMPGVKWANSSNVKDLLAVADATLVINSGVGLLSLMYGKLTLAAGQAFYAQPGLAEHAFSADRILQLLESGARPDPERVLRFTSYLIDDFYSFGTFKTREVAWKETGQRMTATSDIDFYQVRVPGIGGYNRRRNKDITIRRESILFDRYRVAMSMEAYEQNKAAISATDSMQSENAIMLSQTTGRSSASALSNAGSTRLGTFNETQLVTNASYSVNLHSGNRSWKKIKKLIRTPRRYFEESRSPIVLGMYRVFKR
ncbi:glycosyltransferase [Alcaligenaceae bacterium]|nr:glycosyltransferase [Alcaligenaceae bacterium]